MKTTKLITVSLLTLASALPGFAVADTTGDATTYTTTNQSYQSTLQRDVVIMALEAAVANRTFNSVAGDPTQAPEVKPSIGSKRETTKMIFNSTHHMGDAT